MVERVWERFLTDEDRAYVAIHPAARKGTGNRPALLLVDMYRSAFGDEPQPLLEAIRTWPGSCGLAGWRALPHIVRLLTCARELSVPVLYSTDLTGVPGWRDATPRGGPDPRPDAVERRRRGTEILPEVAPIANEIVIAKSSPSAFWGTPLIGVLTGLRVDTLVVAGETTSGCVRATVVDARTHRFRVIVPEECVFDRTEASHALNLFDMDQKYADVVTVDEALAYLRRVAGDGA